ncbi:hypothetical protein SAMN05421810_107263 [Amycolatopsis arida]|uniref:Uncharacterized protein n=1 Tax=Amycolatopsis arida TaxID=587909 RepID=A0A1I5YM34_9PSEU|nr:hypothetical protein [Amycolatopsis arida]TDX90616.1 hypothetical protein CLV69_107263 [Amycolatopsis arida]SFQ45256.1 hypothetical protein SAMN05421810_107263 [Amycolatopsis arida]
MSGERAPEPSGRNQFVKSALRDFGTLGPDPDPLHVEVLTAEILGEAWADEDFAEVIDQLVEAARRKANPGAAALLTALHAMAEDDALREHAADALRAVLRKGIPEPGWADRLGAVSIEECWELADVYGDSASVLGVFGYGDRRHGVFALVQLDDGQLPDVTVVDNPDDLLAGMREQAAESAGLLRMAPIPPARLHRLLAEGLATMDELPEPAVTEEFVRFRAIAVARCRVLPEPEPVAEAEPIGDPEAVVEELLRSTADVPDGPEARYCARLLVRFGEETEPRRPLRVSPERVRRFLLDWLPGEVELSAAEEEVLPLVTHSWVRWGARRQGLPQLAVDELAETVEETCHGADPVEVYLDADEPVADGDELAELLDRRMFAVPDIVVELGDSELALDPTDPEQRQLLVVGEHPEYHDALAEDSPTDDDARVYLALKAAVIDQLWDGEPAEVWSAARRLRDGGRDRDEVVDELVAVLTEHSTSNGSDVDLKFDVDAYRAALAALR